MEQPILSILIPTLHDRSGLLLKLLQELARQIDTNRFTQVEILIESDRGEITTGAKRNKLLQRAKGKYVIFIDDDDTVAQYYIEQLLIAAESDADCFAINGTYTVDGEKETRWYLSKDNPNSTVALNGINVFLRKTNHITAIKREIALQVGFPDKSNAEDKYYSDGINHLLNTEYTIEPPMYWYRYSTLNKTYK